jgi:hypothetical protein
VTARPDWTTMTRADFDASAPLVLFEIERVPQPVKSTGDDLFALLDTDD